ncbi:MAG: 3-mercaptopyruvate sulfurtransferase [Alphaproteobacteria bacterium]|nr:3-mercaptopyruvate sulfurtransferase [Alphaproteobacteria bacterium]
MSPLVSTEWLAAHLGDVRLVDASWYLPDEKREPAKEFVARHIPGAVFFDIDGIADHSGDLPHMLPSAEAFAAALSALGLSDGDAVVVYDGSGLFSAPRVWWSLRAMGHDKVFVLDGGLPKWQREGRPLESGVATTNRGHFHARPNADLQRDYLAVLKHLENDDAQILDARSQSRFTGEEKEPRPGLKSGHMPGAINIPWRSLLTHENTLKSDDDLRRLFAEKGVDIRAPIVTTCGSGISAAIVMLALEKLGASGVSLYDGSWAEWGSRDSAPVATG